MNWDEKIKIEEKFSSWGKRYLFSCLHFFDHFRFLVYYSAMCVCVCATIKYAKIKYSFIVYFMYKYANI